VSSGDGFYLPEPGEPKPFENEASGVDIELDPEIDVGFDFLEDREPGVSADDSEASLADEEVVQVEAGPAGTSEGGIRADEVVELRTRWADLQASFIDDPRRACEQADNLVDLVLKRITEHFARGRDDLVRQWDRGAEPTSTEDLRVAMKGYRALIDRLLEADI
jgi:hypothetical protein